MRVSVPRYMLYDKSMSWHIKIRKHLDRIGRNLADWKLCYVFTDCFVFLARFQLAQ